MKKKQRKCYLYTRVSTTMQVDGYSLDAQRDKLRKYADYEDMVVVGEYSDEGFSGKNIQGRPEFQRMLNDIQDGKDGISYVLVFKLSRFGRNAADVLNSLQLMQDFGVNLICVEDGIDSSKDAGKLMISVLSAVAEIERENIRSQTMAGREQKAREGKWNGGFAPYGYKLDNGNLVIAEDEVEVIRIIYDRYIHTNEGVAGVAKYLNRNGFVKKLRQNNTIPGFSRNFVQDVLDNPVYMGKIAYGRRRTEKKQGTRNEMHVVEQSEFPVYDGQHEAIISEEDWYLAQEKRKRNSFKREKVNNPDHAHILSGILRCPCCGKGMYGNIAKAHGRDKKTRYYYYCKNTITASGHACSFRLNIDQAELNNAVARIISAMVNKPRFAEAIQAKIGTAVDTAALEQQVEVLQGRLKQTLGTKTRLERQMDTLDIGDPHYDRKISDLQRRYDEQYDILVEIESQIDELQSQIRSIRQEKISGDNIYRLLLAFDAVYNSATEAERKELMKAFIERIDLYPEKRKDGCWIRSIVFNFPMPVEGGEVKELSLESETTVEEVEYVLKILQEVEPYGIFSANIRDCLLKQLEIKKRVDSVEYKMVENFLDEIALGKISVISRALSVSTADVRKGISEISKLNPRPLNEISQGHVDYIVPDVILKKDKEDWEVELNDKWVEDYHINDYYLRMMKETNDLELQQYFQAKLDKIRLIMKNIIQRRNTILEISRKIVKYQEKYLEGRGSLCPMTMTDIADELEIHVSTVSRAVKGKYMQCPLGTVAMKDLFSAPSTKGTVGDSSLGAMQIKNMIIEMVALEDKKRPYSDQTITNLLDDKGIHISRRAVAKYREEVGIKGSFLRKE